MTTTKRALAVATVVVVAVTAAAARGTQDAPVHRPADVDVKPKVIEKRLPSGEAPTSLFTSPLVVDFVIEPDGTFPNVRVLQPSSGPQPFTEDYLALLRQWRFQPGRKSGVPVRVAVQLRVEAETKSVAGRGNLNLRLPVSAISWTIAGVEDDFGAGAVRLPAPDVTMPRVLKEVKPVYSPDAMRAKVQGMVEIEAIISTNGDVVGARIVRSASQLLEDEALKAAKGWRFTPAMKDGAPVASVATMSLEFRMAARK